MGLNSLRESINSLDGQILELFTKRMDVCINVAKYKMDNELPVFQGGRESEVIKRIRDITKDGYENSSEVLFTTIMDISKMLQQQVIYADAKPIESQEFVAEGEKLVACQGIQGSYSEQACKTLFNNAKIKFLDGFEDVFKAVDNGEVDFGILPLQNSTAGSVSQTYELMKKYDFYISASIDLEISHCLASKNAEFVSDVNKVYSHSQAIMQCSDFLNNNNLKYVEYSNTATAAKYVSELGDNSAAICSKISAEIYGLNILKENIGNATENHTRFICISKNVYTSKKANIVSVSLSVPHTQGALYRLLTKFSVAGLNLLRIENRPIASKDFDVIFYLDFDGSISDEAVSKMIRALEDEFAYFKFLGNYYEVKSN